MYANITDYLRICAECVEGQCKEVIFQSSAVGRVWSRRGAAVATFLLYKRTATQG